MSEIKLDVELSVNQMNLQQFLSYLEHNLDNYEEQIEWLNYNIDHLSLSWKKKIWQDFRAKVHNLLEENAEKHPLIIRKIFGFVDNELLVEDGSIRYSLEKSLNKKVYQVVEDLPIVNLLNSPTQTRVYRTNGRILLFAFIECDCSDILGVEWRVFICVRKILLEKYQHDLRNGLDIFRRHIVEHQQIIANQKASGEYFNDPEMPENHAKYRQSLVNNMKRLRELIKIAHRIA